MRVHLRGVPLSVIPGTIVTFKVCFANGTREDRHLTLPGGRRFELAVHDRGGNPVLDAVATAPTEEPATPLDVKAGQEILLGKVTWRVPDEAEPGLYRAHAEVAAMEETWDAEVAFEIAPPDRPGHELG